MVSCCPYVASLLMLTRVTISASAKGPCFRTVVKDIPNLQKS